MANNSSRVILITGASSGIGWATALRAGRTGAKLALVARRQEKLDELADKLRSEFRTDCLVIPTDLRRPEQAEECVLAAHRHFGRLDVLVNNAGVLIEEPFDMAAPGVVRDLVETNFWAVYHTTRTAVPLMEKQGEGHIINIGSVAGRRGIPYMALYCASKFALTGFTESLRLELEHKNIFLTLISPGGVETPMPYSVDRSKIPLGNATHRKGIPPEEVADAILRAVDKKPAEVFLPAYSKLAAVLTNTLPSLTDVIVRKVRLGRFFRWT
ncbi:MAG TPA: SDR family NAD(P)-dependent oxidoreductase [Elusimicrobiota bacterium]|nr:SDR family NAD(P)-dependent oxidoreductase [Elusimicrobiota bacterium]